MIRQPAAEVLLRALSRQRLAELSDGNLLDRYARSRDQEAFAELVRRYAGLVWSACRRSCSDDHLAEDAFQNTFIVLARRASSIRRAECLPAWLHGVARRTAGKLRLAATRRTTTALTDLAGSSPSPTDQADGKEIVNLIEAEIERLPEKYRSALLICWFEDDSLDEAASRLGISKGTLWGRLKRGRDLLRQRLNRRGLGLPALLGTMVVTASSAPAGLPIRTVEHVFRELATRAATGVSTVGSWSMIAAKAGGGIAVAAAILIGVVTLLPAGDPTSPEKKEAEPVAKAAPINDGFPIPEGAVHRFGNRQLRHPEGISTSALSPDGKLLATASGTVVVIWDLKTLSAKRILPGIRFNIHGHNDRGGKLAFYPDSKSLLVGVRPPDQPRISVEHAQVWDLETGKMKFALTGTHSYQNSTWLTAGGKEIAVSSEDPTASAIRFFSAADGKELRSVKMSESIAYSSIAADGATLAFAGAAEIGVTVLDVATGKEIHRIAESRFSRFALSRDGKILAAVDADGKVRVHDVVAKKELLAFDHPEKTLPGPMLISDDGTTLYFTSSHGRLFRWNLKEDKKGPDFGNRHNFWNLTGIALNESDGTLISTSLDHLVKRWDLKTGNELELPKGYTTRTTSVVSRDGKHLILSDHEGQIDFWELATGRMVKQLQPAHLGGINCLAQSPDGRWLAAGRTSQDVRLFDLSTGKVVRDIPLGDNSDSKWGDHVSRLEFNGDGTTLFTSSGKTGVTAWEMPTGKRLWNTPETGYVMAIDPKGRWIAASGPRREAPVRGTMLNARTGEVIGQFEVEATERNNLFPPYLSDLAFTPDGSRLLTAHYDGAIREWDPESRTLLRIIKTHPFGGVAFLACSPDGRSFAVGAWDHAVTVWEMATGKQVLALAGHQSDVTQVSFTRDGRGVISHADLAPVLWSLTPDRLPSVDGAATELWEGLASDDAAKSYRLQWALSKKPEIAVALFRERVKPAELTVDREKFEKWRTGLDHPQFRVREASEKELREAGQRLPVAWLRKALAESKSDEQRSRLDRVLIAREKQANPNDWRLSRAVQVLELAGSSQAKELLQDWSKSSPDSPLSVEATAALSRLR